MNLPDRFDEYNDALRNGFLKIKDLKDRGQSVVGVFCTYTPLELIYAADAIPFGLCGSSDLVIKYSEVDLPRNLCPLIKSSYGFAKSENCPYFYFSDLIVGETTCDGKKKMYEILSEMKETYVINIPQGYDYQHCFTYMREEMVKFKNYLEDFFNIKITNERLRKEIKDSNSRKKIMSEYLELGKLIPSPLSGFESNISTEAITFEFDKVKSSKIIKEKTADLKLHYEKELKNDLERAKRPRILITGCPTIGVREKVLRKIEELGADVVVFETCNGIREKFDYIDEDIDPIDALTKKYMNISCSVMSPNKKRLKIMEELIDEFQVDGVIEVVLQACHTFAVESFQIKNKVVADLEKPYLYLETDYSDSDSGQITTRLETFIEILKSNKE